MKICRTSILMGVGVPSVVALLITATLSTPAITSAANSAESDQLNLSATLVGMDGLPVADTTVRLDNLVAGPGGSETGVPLAVTVTDGDGVFSFAADASQLERDATGSYILEIETLGASRADGFVFDFQAIPPAAPGGPWTPEMPSVAAAPGNVGSAQRSRVRRALARSVTTAGTSLVFQAHRGLVAAGDRTSVAGAKTRNGVAPSITGPGDGTGSSDPSMGAPSGEDGSTTQTEDGTGAETLPSGYSWADPNTLQAVSDPSKAQSSATSCRPTESTWWNPIDKHRYNYVPTKWGKTQGKATLAWSISRTQQTQLSIALNVAGDWSKQGLTGSLEQDSNVTWAPTMAHDSRQLFDMKWEYNKEQKMCQPAVQEQLSYGLDVYRWVPDRPTGGNLKVDTAAIKACGGSGPAYHDPFSAPTSLTTSTTVTYSGFFEIGYAKLDVQQATGSSQTFSINPDSGKTAHACGNDDSPLYAHFAKEDGD